MKRIEPKKTAKSDLLTITETSQELGVARQSVYNMIEDGRLKTRKIGGTTYVKFKKEK